MISSAWVSNLMRPRLMCTGSGGRNRIASCSVWQLRCQSKLELIDTPNPNLLTKLLHELCECVHTVEKFDSFDGMGDGTLRLGLRHCSCTVEQPRVVKRYIAFDKDWHYGQNLSACFLKSWMKVGERMLCWRVQRYVTTWVVSYIFRVL